jgi:hypothetical protein
MARTFVPGSCGRGEEALEQHAGRDQPKGRQLTVLSTTGPNRAAAFNRIWGWECILNTRVDKLFELNTTALILKGLGATR